MNNFLSLTNFYNLIKLITSNQVKFVRSLHLKKNRDVHNCFIVEGEKIIDEILRSDSNVHSIFATKDCKSIVIENLSTGRALGLEVDGEYVGIAPCEFKSVPGAVKIFLPKKT